MNRLWVGLWGALTVGWALNTIFRIVAGEEYHTQAIIFLLCLVLFNQAGKEIR